MSKKTKNSSSQNLKNISRLNSSGEKSLTVRQVDQLDNIDDIETMANAILERLDYLVEYNKKIRYKAEKLTQETRQMFALFKK